jgi:Flp pilus assembly protein TadG
MKVRHQPYSALKLPEGPAPSDHDLEGTTIVLAVTTEPRPSPGKRLMELLRDERGVIAVMVAILIAGIIGLTGLAVEAGFWYALKRQNQTATDAAALTAAFEYAGAIQTGLPISCPASNSICPSGAASTTAGNNQFSTGTPNTVTVNTPVCTAGKCTVQVVLGNQLDTLFGQVSLPSTVNILTTATAGYQTLLNAAGNPVGQSCLLGLGTYGSSPPSGEVLRVNGYADFTAPNCLLSSLSTDGDSIRCNGCSNSGNWDIGGMATAGGITINGQTPPVPLLTQQPMRNPYALVTKSPLTGSIPSGPCISGTWNSGTHAVDSTKLYCDLTISGTAIVTFPSNKVIYIDGGDFSISGSGASVTGTGVTIVLTKVANPKPGGINIDPSCGATISLSAPGPGSGLLQDTANDANSATISQGLLIFQDPTFAPASSSNTIATGKASTSCASATVTLAGAIVTPRSNVTLKGNEVVSVKGCTEFIAQKFTFSGTPHFDDSGCNAPTGSGGGTQGGDGSTGVTINQATIEQVFLTQ